MRGATTVTVQILGAAVALAVVGGLIGLLVIHFASTKTAATGIGWGMVIGGGLAGLAVGQSGSPSENFQRGRLYPRGLPGFNRPTRSIPMPESPLQVALGGALALGAGVAVLVLFAY